MKGVQRDEALNPKAYPRASHMTEDALFRGYRHAGEEESASESAAIEPMTALEIRQRHVAAVTIEAEERAAAREGVA